LNYDAGNKKYNSGTEALHMAFVAAGVKPGEK
jgi:dTDP-4-amino-4,6-dideoxygalactose transaminase